MSISAPLTGRVWKMREIRKVLVLSFVLVLVLCGCGKSEEGQEEKDISIKKDVIYEMEWIDCSNLPKIHNINSVKMLDSKLYIMLTTLESTDKDGRYECGYNVTAYDIETGEWDDIEEIAATSKINQIGTAGSFQMSEDGVWYFVIYSWDQKQKQYTEKKELAKLTEDGEMELVDLEIPSTMLEEGQYMQSFLLLNDGKMRLLFDDESEGTIDDEANFLLYDLKTGEVTSSGEMVVPFHFSLQMGNEYYCQTVEGDKCGFKVKELGSNQIVKELYCEGEVPEGGWLPEALGDLCISAKDDNENVYILNSGGIYGGNRKGNTLQPIVPMEVIEQIGFPEATDLSQNKYVTEFWRGNEEIEDFYFAVLEYKRNQQDGIKLSLAHIKATD